VRAARLGRFLAGVGGGMLLALPGNAFEMDVEGLGWRAEKRLERLLRDILRDPEAVDPRFDAPLVEDALLILRGELRREGFLSPEIEYSLRREGETLGAAIWAPPGDLADLPWAEGRRLVLHVERGPRTFFHQVDFDGLTALTPKEARAYFFPQGGLFVTERERAYSPGALDSGLGSLRRRLALEGYPQALATLAEPPEIAPSGEVSLRVRVDEGPRFVWGRLERAGEVEAGAGRPLTPPEPGTAFTDTGLQDLLVAARNRYHVAGFPDARVSAERLPEPGDTGDTVRVNVRLNVDPGPRVRLGGVRFEGLGRTDEAFLRDYLELDEGAWLNLREIDQAQFDLGRLGVFRRVRHAIVPSGQDAFGGEAREAVFTVEERERTELSALLGYGSYERVRVGVEGRAFNLFGRAHSGHARLRQSFRSSAGLLLYNVPRPLTGLDLGQARLQGLRREEVSFTREEALAAIGVERAFLDGAIRTRAEFRYELLRSVELRSREFVGDTRATVGSLLLGLGWDTRDRPIAPREGASLHAQLELANPLLGSDANFQRWVVRSSLHRSFDQARLRWHFGLEGGVLSRVGAEAFELPVNKRFFPGGENSVRGYKEGEASPLDGDGKAIGAEAYLLGHLEFEMRLLQSLGLVLFTDALWAAADLNATGAAETLFSTGLGLRYSTPLGPLRLEYGYNLNPRPADPTGTLHLSIGFPF
jgi:outer membrane protein insertion porin family